MPIVKSRLALKGKGREIVEFFAYFSYLSSPTDS